ncbi:MAG: NAD(P)H-dependent oxidoreductase [Pseudomonadota bacterium]|nr:NAD(P)H-dependent oxidoreductase [Pseudomonadota bacterium]
MSHGSGERGTTRLRAAPRGASGRVLVLVAHPAMHRSRVNRVLASSILGIEGVTVHDLYDAYPDFDIDVKREQALLLAHPIIVWQHPFYWYSTPAILKEWQDLVLEFGWAYGPGGHALNGKTFLSAITTGGPDTAYQPGGYNRFTIRQLLAPIEQSMHLCGIRTLPPFVVHGSHRLTDADIEHSAVGYRRVIEALRDGRLDPDRLDGPSLAAATLTDSILAPGA